MKSRLLSAWTHNGVRCWVREVKNGKEKWYCGYVECGFVFVTERWSFTEELTYRGDLAELLNHDNVPTDEEIPAVGFDTQGEVKQSFNDAFERTERLADEVAEINQKVLDLYQPEQQLNSDEFTKKVIDWADDKHLLIERNADTGEFAKQANIKRSRQLLKFHEECGELTEDYLKGNDEHIVDSFGDVLVTLVIFAKQMDIPLSKCWNKAWSHIKNRKGKTVNGTFVKDGDR